MVQVVTEDREEYTLTREGDVWSAVSELGCEEYLGPLLFILECIL